MKLANWLLTLAFVLFFSSPHQHSVFLNTDSKLHHLQKPRELNDSPSKKTPVTPASKTRLQTSTSQKALMPPQKVGTLTAKINGTQYVGDLFEGDMSGYYEVTSGNKNYEIRLQFKYTTFPSAIKEAVVDLSQRNPDFGAEYINFNVPDKYVVNSGSVMVNNDGRKVTGMFNFTATVEGYTRNSKNTTFQLSDGTFEIDYAN